MGDAAPHEGHDVVLNPAREARRSDEYGLLEERPLHGVRFVEDGQGEELTPDDDPFHGDFASWQVGLDQNLGRLAFASPGDAAVPENVPNPMPGTDELLGRISPDHATAGRERKRLENAGENCLRRHADRIVLE